QKISYLATVPITFFMAWTGFAIYTPAHEWAIWPLFAAAINLAGSEMAIRVWHYFGMWVVILFTMIHAYLAAVEGIACYKLIFAWVESPGSDDH
ncbi:MAG: cytochrome B, partial [Coriobacteriia bacterium]|nr:cytochrome B [Coriobacteriia bacterium]